MIVKRAGKDEEGDWLLVSDHEDWEPVLWPEDAKTLAARGRSTFSELRRYAPVAAAMATLTPTFGAERPQSV